MEPRIQAVGSPKKSIRNGTRKEEAMEALLALVADGFNEMDVKEAR